VFERLSSKDGGNAYNSEVQVERIGALQKAVEGVKNGTLEERVDTIIEVHQKELEREKENLKEFARLVNQYDNGKAAAKAKVDKKKADQLSWDRTQEWLAKIEVQLADAAKAEADRADAAKARADKAKADKARADKARADELIQETQELLV